MRQRRRTTGRGELMASLIAFFAGCRGHQASSAAVLAHFAANAAGPQAVLLKSTLKQVATWN
jgi:hydroxyethylthiazole kinase-like sugar kinase family protein